MHISIHIYMYTCVHIYIYIYTYGCMYNQPIYNIYIYTHMLIVTDLYKVA